MDSNGVLSLKLLAATVIKEQVLVQQNDTVNLDSGTIEKVLSCLNISTKKPQSFSDGALCNKTNPDCKHASTDCAGFTISEPTLTREFNSETTTPNELSLNEQLSSGHLITDTNSIDHIIDSLKLDSNFDPNLLPGIRDQNIIYTEKEFNPNEEEENIAVSAVCFGDTNSQERKAHGDCSVQDNPDITLYEGASHNFKFTNPTKLCIESDLPFAVHVEIFGQHKAFSGQYSYNYQPSTTNSRQQDNYCKIEESNIDINYCNPHSIQPNNNYILNYSGKQLEKQNQVIADRQNASENLKPSYDIKTEQLQVNVQLKPPQDDNVQYSKPHSDLEDQQSEETDDVEVIIEEFHSNSAIDVTNGNCDDKDFYLNHSQPFLPNIKQEIFKEYMHDRLLLNNNNSHLSEIQLLQNLAQNLKASLNGNAVAPMLDKWAMSAGMLSLPPSMGGPVMCDYPPYMSNGPLPPPPPHPISPQHHHLPARGFRFWPPPPPLRATSYPHSPPLPFGFARRVPGRGRMNNQYIPPRMMPRHRTPMPFHMPRPRFHNGS